MNVRRQYPVAENSMLRIDFDSTTQLSSGDVVTIDEDIRLNFRGFGFNNLVTITVNGDSSKTFLLNPYEFLYLSDSIESFSVDSDCTLYWSE